MSISQRTGLVCLLWLWLAAVAIPVIAQDRDEKATPTTVADSQPRTPKEFRERIEQILDTPEFETEKEARTWQWRGRVPELDDEGEFDASFLETLMERVGAFFGWLAEALEALLWAGAVLLLVLIYLYRHRWLSMVMRARGERGGIAARELCGLDIRPESLPQDIPAAARAAWLAGDATRALSLLYRGALSQLVHVHHLEVSAGATEEDCVRLVGGAGVASLAEYFAQLTRAWQRLAYAARAPIADEAAVLLDEYAKHFGGSAG